MIGYADSPYWSDPDYFVTALFKASALDFMLNSPDGAMCRDDFAAAVDPRVRPAGDKPLARAFMIALNDLVGTAAVGMSEEAGRLVWRLVDRGRAVRIRDRFHREFERLKRASVGGV